MTPSSCRHSSGPAATSASSGKTLLNTSATEDKEEATVTTEISQPPRYERSADDLPNQPPSVPSEVGTREGNQIIAMMETRAPTGPSSSEGTNPNGEAAARDFTSSDPATRAA